MVFVKFFCCGVPMDAVEVKNEKCGTVYTAVYNLKCTDACGKTFKATVNLEGGDRT